jgi:hypothetical protein
MCDLCLANSELLIADVVPNVHFEVACCDNGEGWERGEYGFVFMNGPFVTWKGLPIVDPYDGLSDDEIDMIQNDDPILKLNQHYLDVNSDIEDYFYMRPNVAYWFIQSCIKDGYKPEEDGSVVFWVMNILAKKLKEKGIDQAYVDNIIATKPDNQFTHKG